ncbi:LacI family DNA-binding transcriptional regulator [Noviherbaspirillum aerium]|uniref:LacI family DNA-binding transcriptional regulator n=1 Tax=Noviherbaspirillum aerium TaxID=2588497 RepID=UPI00298F3EE2|nr:substrate-binding domain-containing protein [Noviherbaspirillum aerium]
MTMNLRSFAKSLNISETTASRALNGYPEVSQKTRERVLAAAKALGYQPNPIARGLAVGRMNAIGMIFPVMNAELENQEFLGFLSSAAKELESRGMNFFITPASHSHLIESYENLVNNHRVDGLVVTHCKVQDERIDYLARRGVPFVAMGHSGEGLKHAWFDYDYDAGMRLALSKLLELGHQRIAYIGDAPDLASAAQKLEAFKAHLGDTGFSADPALMATHAGDRRSGYLAMQNFLQRSPRPTAVIVDNPHAGAGAMHAMLSAGIRVGQDISIVTWGSLSNYEWAQPQTSIVDPAPEQTGAKIVGMLLDLIDGKPATELQERQPVEMTDGETIGPCAF